MAKLEALASLTTPCCPPPIRSRVSEQGKSNRSGGDAQVVSCNPYLVFHPFVEQLTVFHTSGLVMASSSIFRVHAIARWHPGRHVPKIRKLCIKPYILIVNPLQTDRHTDMHTYIHT